MTVYSTLKLMHLFSHYNPVIASHKIENAISSDDHYNMEQTNLPFAFTLEGYIVKETKDDPRYVKTFARTYRITDGVK